MEKEYIVVKVKCGTLEIVRQEKVYARNIDSARGIGEARYGTPGYFVGAQSIPK